MRRRTFRASYGEMLFCGVCALGPLLWLATLPDLPVFSRVSVFAVCAAIAYGVYLLVSSRWRQFLTIEPERIRFFDGRTNQTFAFDNLERLRFYYTPGTPRQGPSITLSFFARDTIEPTHWDVSDFALGVIVRIICLISCQLDLPATAVEQFGSERDLRLVTRKFGTLAPAARQIQPDQSTLSRWDKYAAESSHSFWFTPHCRDSP